MLPGLPHFSLALLLPCTETEEQKRGRPGNEAIPEHLTLKKFFPSISTAYIFSVSGTRMEYEVGRGFCFHTMYAHSAIWEGVGRVYHIPLSKLNDARLTTFL